MGGKQVSGQRVITGQWNVQVYTVQESSYDTLELRDMVRSQWIISHVLNGEVVTSCGGESAAVHAGDVMIHPPNLPFMEFASVPGTHHWIALDVRNADGIDLFKLHPVQQVVSLSEPHRFTAIFEELHHLFMDGRRSYDDFVTIGLTMRLLGMLLDDAYAADASPAKGMWTVDVRFAPVIRFMESHMHEKLTRADMAALLHQSPNHFDKRFMQAYGVTAMDMLRDMRLRKARRLLEQTSHTLEHIAQKCGLGDAAYLSRQFTRRYGMTSGECRKQARLGQADYLPDAEQPDSRAAAAD